MARKDLSDIELAYALQKRVDAGQTHEQIAKAIGKTRAFVSQRIALLRLPQEIQDRLLKGSISFSNARELLTIKDHALQGEVSQQIDSETTALATVALVSSSNAA